MISKATVHKATVLMNRRMNAERGPAAAGFVPVCSNVTGMFQHHLEGTRAMQEVSASVLGRMRDALPSCYLVIAHRACYGLRPR
jgi:hypothetical protein